MGKIRNVTIDFFINKIFEGFTTKISYFKYRLGIKKDLKSIFIFFINRDLGGQFLADQEQSLGRKCQNKLRNLQS